MLVALLATLSSFPVRKAGPPGWVKQARASPDDIVHFRLALKHDPQSVALLERRKHTLRRHTRRFAPHSTRSAVTHAASPPTNKINSAPTPRKSAPRTSRRPRARASSSSSSVFVPVVSATGASIVFISAPTNAIASRVSDHRGVCARAA